MLVMVWALSGYDMAVLSMESVNFQNGGFAWVCGTLAVVAAIIGKQAWKLRVLYGSERREPYYRAFKRENLEQTSIDEARLREVVGPWPTTGREQKLAVYKLSERYGGHPTVAEAHKRFLLTRDWSWISLTIGVLGAAVSVAWNGWTEACWHVLAAIGQLVGTWWVARVHGRELVRQILSTASRT